MEIFPGPCRVAEPKWSGPFILGVQKKRHGQKDCGQKSFCFHRPAYLHFLHDRTDYIPDYPSPGLHGLYSLINLITLVVCSFPEPNEINTRSQTPIRRTPNRIAKLIALVSVAFMWVYLIGISRNSACPIKIKKHRRKAYCLFKYGLIFIAHALLNPLQSMIS